MPTDVSVPCRPVPPGVAVTGPAVRREAWGQLADGTPVDRWLLSAGGVEVGVASFGGVITHILQPDRAGMRANVVLGFPDLAGYVGNATDKRPFFGALIGRYANRIADAGFSLDGVRYQLDANNGPNTLHGGRQGFDRQRWDVTPGADTASVTLRLASPAGSGGFPGSLQVRVRYTVTAAGELAIEYHATTDAPTVINLTNHSYFNLAGEGSGTVGDQVIRIAADHYLPVNAGLLPLGDPAPVDGTPYDLRQPVAIGHALGQAGGFDHNWVLDGPLGPDGMRLAAVASDPASGRRLECRTTEPGVQFYTGNFLDGSVTGPSGRPYPAHAGFTLETQHFPDSPNQPSYPSTVLRPGTPYHSRTAFRFSCTDLPG